MGNPVRPEVVEGFEAARRSASDESSKRILVIGGSQGARSLNRDLPRWLAALAGQVALEVRHSAGRGRSDEVLDAYAGADWVTVEEYIDDMAAAYSWADLVISRAGASSAAELTAIGMPALYVPFPHAADNHQEKNAQAVVEAGGGLMWSDSQLAGEPDETAVAELESLLKDEARLSQMGESAREIGRPNAGRDIAEALLALV